MTDFAGFKPTDLLRRDGELTLSRGHVGDGGSILLLAASTAHPSPVTIERLKRELALRDDLDGEWASRPLSLDREGGRMALAFEDCGGEPLSRLIVARTGPVRHAEVSRRLKIAVALASALAGMHGRGLIHKDINPTNVLVDAAGDKVHLIGFGLASRMPREQLRAEPVETIAGTFAYMAPEQTGRMNRSVDSRSDLYSFGVTCYEMFTGTLPFTAADPMEWVHCHIARQPTPPATRAPGIPRAISEIVMKLLAKTAEDRYQTASGVAADFARCLTEWEMAGRIEMFPLGQHDVSGRLMIPEKLYGRERESAALLKAFTRVAKTGAPELVLVSGYSGVGKSALVNQIHPAMVEHGGLFGAGKFDLHKRDIPYATFAQALHALVRQIISTSESEIRRWRETILDAVSPNGALIVDLIPQLALVIGEQPPLADLPPTEAMTRVLSTFRQFVSALARPEQPLVLFLDDLQWMDGGSMKLLEHLMTHPEVRSLLLIGSYRDNEVDSSHPLMASFDAIRKGGHAVCDIVLSPLSPKDLGRLITEALRCPSDRAASLVRLIHDKTAGNPFFAIQFLSTLADERLLTFDAGTAGWAWDIERIRAKGFSDNVVELMAAKLKRLPEADRLELQRVACIGNTASLAVLSMIYDRTEEATAAGLEEAVRAGFLMISGDRIQFTHDRIQEAAYLAIPVEDRAAAHLHVGRRLVERMDGAALDDMIFDVVHHLNLGRRLIEAAPEREKLCRLNLLAGRKAKASSANASARAYFLQARGLLSEESWDRAHDDTFGLFLALSECEYLIGNHAQADELFGLLLGKARSDDQQVQVWRLRVRMFMVSGRYGDAVDIAIEALGRFGLTCPKTEADSAVAVEAARRDLDGLRAGRSIASLGDDLPECADSSVRALVGVIADAIPAVYHVRPLLYPFLGLTAINLSLRHGVTVDSCAAFGGYSVSLVGRFEDFQTGLEFSEAALRLEERFPNADLRGTLLFRHGYFVSPWRRPIDTVMPILTDCFRTCLDSGNLIYAAYVAYASAWMLFEKGEPLDVVLAHMQKYTPFARNSRIIFATLMIRLQKLFITGLQGVRLECTEGVVGLDNAANSFTALVATAHGYGIAFYHVVKQITPYLMGRYADSLAAADETTPLVPKISSSVIEASYHLYGALAITALFRSADEAERQRLAGRLSEHRRKLRLWACNCPETFASRSILVEAEVARIENRENEAMRLFEEAILAAREHGHLHCEAIANERAAEMFAERGLPTIAETYLRNARYCYARWGANAKVEQLDQLYPRLAEGAAATGGSATYSGLVEGLDLMTVVKAQQAVSGEIVLGKLVESLLRIVVEHAGADRGLLILRQGDVFHIGAEAVTEGDRITVTAGQGEPGQDDLPLSVFLYVARSRDRVVLDNASDLNSFVTEDYAARTGVKSILCLPVITHGELSAVVYLENRLTVGAFTRNRIAVLDLLATQASISLENATLYAEMEGRVADRTRELAASLATVKAKSEQVSVLLDNSGQGFLSFGRDLIVEPEFSQACLKFFNGSPAGRPIDMLLFSGNLNARDTLRACIEEALAESDPDRCELYLSLLPQEITIGDKTLKAEFKSLGRAIMVVLTDITEEKALAAQVAREQTRLEMIVSAVTYGNDFFDAVAEFNAFAQAGAEDWVDRDKSLLYRTIHTFKGTFNQLGFHHLPAALHEAESALQRLGPKASGAEAGAVVFDRDWAALVDADLSTVTETLGEDFMARRGVVTVPPELAKRFELFARGMLDESEVPKVLEEIATIRAVSLRHSLAEFNKLILQVSARLDKVVAPLVVEGDDVRIDPEVFGPFLRSLGHVFRNAVDHGIEDPDSRIAAGKSEVGAIRCGISRKEGEVKIEIADDGGGIDVEALRQRALELTGTDVRNWNLVDLVFGEGISSRSETTELSGRGVGMPAVRASVEELGGSVWVDSKPGRGTSFVFQIPLPVGGSVSP